MSNKFSPGSTITSSWLNQVDDLLSAGGSGVASFNTRVGAVTLSSSDVTTALGYTPQIQGSYAPATSGVSILYGNGSGGFSNVTIGSGLSFSGGTLAASGGSMVYPGAGIPNSTGTSWGTSYSTTGSGTVVLSTSPTLVTPILGTPTSGNLVNCTFPTLNQNTTGTAANVTGLVAVANGGTGTSTPGLVAGTNVTISGTWPNQTIAATGSGGGTVTSVSGVNANGFNISVNTPTTTPSIVVSTAITGLMKGNGTTVSAAVAGTDYAAATTGTSAQLLANSGSGGFANVTVGSGLTLSAGTLTASGGGGAWTKISTLIASSSSFLAWTGLSGYSKYALIIEYLKPSATDAFTLVLGTGAGPTYITSGYLSEGIYTINTTTTPVNASSAAFNLGEANVGTAYGLSGVVYLGNVDYSITSAPATVIIDSFSQFNSTPSTAKTSTGGSNLISAAVTAIKIVTAGSNTITSGKATLYGIT